MKLTKQFLLTLILTVLAAFGAAAAQAGVKVEICHIPPGNEDNFHTITISENALSAHLAHGDLGEPCNAVCATLCDDNDQCTIDDTGDCDVVGCPVIPEPLDCNDSNECTNDFCDSLAGCVNEPFTGASCDDGAICTGPDTCNAQGVCVGADIDDCCLGDEDCSQDLCERASCNLDTNRCGDDPVICNPSDLCHVSECASDTGECVEAPVQCGSGETCNPATGACEPELAAVSCADILANNPSAADGVYQIDPDGTGSGAAAFQAYCDMTFDGGGWTLILHTDGRSVGGGPLSQFPFSPVLPGDHSHLPATAAQSLALVSSQVNIHTPGLEATKSITSTANGQIIQNLRNLRILTNGVVGFSAAAANWSGPWPTGNVYSLYDCSFANRSYPEIWHACGNNNGLHLEGTSSSQWRFGTFVREPIGVYVR